jgi:hypothetical protein
MQDYIDDIQTSGAEVAVEEQCILARYQLIQQHVAGSYEPAKPSKLGSTESA